MFKKILALFFLLILTLPLNAKIPYGPTDTVKVKFDKKGYDFGIVKKGKTTQTEFIYTNTSDGPLIIESVKRPCTCTKIRWNKKPLKPGDSDTISVIFNAKDEGAFFKIIEVKLSSVEKPEQITIKGIVE